LAFTAIMAVFLLCHMSYRRKLRKFAKKHRQVRIEPTF
jgi:hypothetical protein